MRLSSSDHHEGIVATEELSARTMAEPLTPTRVQFATETSGDSKPKLRQQPTQKYDRKEIQKRLDIENWMDEQLRDLYDCEVSQ